MKRFRGLLSALALVPIFAFANLQVADLSVDQLSQPIGIDNTQPRLSWKLRSDTPSTLQTAYEIRVASPDRAAAGEWWSTNKVDSDQSLYIPYSGPALASSAQYQWQVRVWDNHGNVSEWSTPSQWEMGLLQPVDWKAQWITYPWQEDTEKSQPSPLLRKTFKADGEIARARLYITSLGLYEAFINGERVGDAYFTPGWTSYDKRLQYQAYDVTNHLRAGANAIGVVLGDGWYRGFLTWEMQRNLYGDRLALLAQLVVEYRDGRREVIATDGSWQAGTAEIRASDIYNGELQDLRLRKPDWARAEFGASDWQSARPFTGSVPKLVASASQPVRQVNLLKPVALLKGPGGATIVDMGQNMVGWVRLKVQGKAGQQITLYHTEVLDQQGALYRTALRNAQQRVDYILPDEQLHTLQPHFSFQGFRYVQIDNLPDVKLDDIEGVVLSSDLPQLGRFETSNALLNKLQSNIVWGRRGNFLDIPTDCPQRDERLGWTGDLQVFASTAAFNVDSAAFLRKWLNDAVLDQQDDGGIPNVVPDALKHLRVRSLSTFFVTRGLSSSGWGDAITVVPSALYRQYGDKAALADYYDSMKRWVEYERAGAASFWFTWFNYHNWFDSQRRADDRFIWNGTYTFGDWLAPKPVENTFANTVYFARSAQLLSDAARVLGKSEDEKTYAQLARDIRAAFQRRFMTEDGLFIEDVQGAYVLALQFDMLEPSLRAKAAARLRELVQKDDNHLATGFLSTPHLLDVLTQHGYLDTAYAVLQQQTYPSWLYPISKGATTIWERWGSIQPDGNFGDNGMNSFNHYAYGAVGDWMYRNIGGIQPLAPGYKYFRIAPLPGGDLTSANVSFESRYGLIASNWHKSETGMTVDVDVPANTSAEFVFPIANATLTRDGAPIVVGNGIENIATNATGQPVLKLGSGHYSFSATQQ